MTIKKLGPLEYILNTPSHHRVHHGREPKYIDKNHAGVFITWDMLFGTFQKEEEKPVYGITRPVKSWNPVWVNFQHYAFMISELKNIPGIWNKIKFTFNKPGWYPEEMGGYKPAPAIDRENYHKFQTLNHPRVNYYVLFQYILALLATALFLFNMSLFDINEKALIVFLITITIVNCGALFEMKNWVLFAEKVRVVLYSGIVIYLGYMQGWDPLLLGIGGAYLILSIAWLLSLNTTQRSAVSGK